MNATANAPTSVPPKAGDRVQIRQHVWLPEGTVARPPVPSGPSSHWVYAEVVDLVAGEHAGEIAALRVRVNHPMNHLHGQDLVVPAADVRTAADVEQLAARATTPELKRHFQVQADKLKGAAPKAPKGLKAPL